MTWRYTDWWGTLLDGIIGAAIGGVVAAGVALLVVRMTSQQQRRDDLRTETRRAVLQLLMVMEEIRDEFNQAPPKDIALHQRQIVRELAQARALITLMMPDGNHSTNLRVATFAFIAGLTASIAGEPPAVYNTPYTKFRELTGDILSDLQKV